MTAAQSERVLPVGHRLGPVFGDDPPSRAPRVVQLGAVQQVLSAAEDRVWRAARPDPALLFLGDPQRLHLRVVSGGDDPQLVPELERRGLLLRLPAAGVAPAAVRGLRARPHGAGLTWPGPLLTSDLGLPELPLLRLTPDEAWHWQLAVVAPDLVTAARLVAADALDREPADAELGAALDDLVALVARVIAAGCGRLDVADQPW